MITGRATAYGPSSTYDPMQGGLASSRRGPDGEAIVRTLEDYRQGLSGYVTLAGNPDYYGNTYSIPSISYTYGGQTYTLENVPAVVHDTGGAFKNAKEGRFDIPVAADLTMAQLSAQPFSGREVTFTPLSREEFAQVVTAAAPPTSAPAQTFEVSAAPTQGGVRSAFDLVSPSQAGAPAGTITTGAPPTSVIATSGTPAASSGVPDLSQGAFGLPAAGFDVPGGVPIGPPLEDRTFIGYANDRARGQVGAMTEEGRAFVDRIGTELGRMGAMGYSVPEQAIVTSGARDYRTNSTTHPSGLAVDFRTRDLSPEQQRSQALAAMSSGALGIGLFGGDERFGGGGMAPHLHADKVGTDFSIIGSGARANLSDIMSTVAGGVPMADIGRTVRESIDAGVRLGPTAISPDLVRTSQQTFADINAARVPMTREEALAARAASAAAAPAVPGAPPAPAAATVQAAPQTPAAPAAAASPYSPAPVISQAMDYIGGIPSTASGLLSGGVQTGRGLAQGVVNAVTAGPTGVVSGLTAANTPIPGVGVTPMQALAAAQADPDSILAATVNGFRDTAAKAALDRWGNTVTPPAVRDWLAGAARMGTPPPATPGRMAPYQAPAVPTPGQIGNRFGAPPAAPVVQSLPGPPAAKPATTPAYDDFETRRAMALSGLPAVDALPGAPPANPFTALSRSVASPQPQNPALAATNFDYGIPSAAPEDLPGAPPQNPFTALSRSVMGPGTYEYGIPTPTGLTMPAAPAAPATMAAGAFGDPYGDGGAWAERAPTITMTRSRPTSVPAQAAPTVQSLPAIPAPPPVAPLPSMPAVQSLPTQDRFGPAFDMFAGSPTLQVASAPGAMPKADMAPTPVPSNRETFGPPLGPSEWPSVMPNTGLPATGPTFTPQMPAGMAGRSATLQSTPPELVAGPRSNRETYAAPVGTTVPGEWPSAYDPTFGLGAPPPTVGSIPSLPADLIQPSWNIASTPPPSLSMPSLPAPAAPAAPATAMPSLAGIETGMGFDIPGGPPVAPSVPSMPAPAAPAGVPGAPPTASAAPITGGAGVGNGAGLNFGGVPVNSPTGMAPNGIASREFGFDTALPSVAFGAIDHTQTPGMFAPAALPGAPPVAPTGPTAAQRAARSAAVGQAARSAAANAAAQRAAEIQQAREAFAAAVAAGTMTATGFDVPGAPVGYETTSLGYGPLGPMTPAGYEHASDPAASAATKIVCTAMNRAYGFGSYRNAIWLRYSADHLKPEHERGYHAIFGPVLRFAEPRSSLPRRAAWAVLTHLVRHRTADLRAVMHGRRRDPLGRIYRAIFEPLCAFVGRRIGRDHA